MDERTYANFDLLIEPCGDHFMARVIDSPAGQAAAEFEYPFAPYELEYLVASMGHGRGRARRIDSTEMRAIKVFGTKLFATIFGPEVYACYMRSLDKALANERGLRIRLRINVPRFSNLPWEFLYDPQFGKFPVLSQDTPLVRYVELPYSTQPVAVQAPVHILVMISSPKDYPSLDVEEEWRRLNGALEQRIRAGQVVLHRLAEPTLTALQEFLRHQKVHIFHYTGHGKYFESKGDGMLLLQDGTGAGLPTSGERLGMILHDHHSLQLVVLNACEGARTSVEDPYAGVAQTLVRQGIPAVLAMQFEIFEDAAVTLAQQFYGALADGYPVDAALSEARKAIFASNNDVEWGTPVLFMRVPDGVLFSVEKPAPSPQVPPGAAEGEARRGQVEPESEDKQQAEQELREKAAAGAERKEKRQPKEPAAEETDRSAAKPVAAASGEAGSQVSKGSVAKPARTQAAPQEPAPAIAAPQATEAQKKSAKAHLELGAKRERSGIYKQAIAEYTTAIELDPQCAEAYNARGVLYTQKQRTKAALADFAKAIELDPNYAAAYTNRGMLHFSEGQYQAAAADLSKVAELRPADAEALNNRGVIQAILSRDEAALNDYAMAVTLNPALAFAWANSGVLHSKLGKYDQAIADYSLAIQLNLEQAEFFSLRSLAFSAMGMSKEAKADLREFERLAGKGAQPVESWFGLHVEEGGVVRQLAISGRPVVIPAGRQEPERPPASQTKQAGARPHTTGAGAKQAAADHLHMAEQKMQAGDYRQAAEEFTRAGDADPADARAYSGRAYAYHMLGKSLPALEDFFHAIELDPGNAQLYNNRGNVYAGLKQNDKALADYAKAIRLDPKYAVAYFNRGNVYSTMKNYKAAIADYSQAIELAPDDPDAYLGRSEANKALGNNTHAAADMRQYERRAKGTSGILRWLKGS